MDKVYATGERFVAERLPIRLDYPGAQSGQRYLDFIYEPVKDESGRVDGIFCEGFDVTMGHVAEEALREETRALATLNRIASATVAEKNLERIGQLVTDAGGRAGEGGGGEEGVRTCESRG